MSFCVTILYSFSPFSSTNMNSKLWNSIVSESIQSKLPAPCTLSATLPFFPLPLSSRVFAVRQLSFPGSCRGESLFLFHWTKQIHLRERCTRLPGEFPELEETVELDESTGHQLFEKIRIRQSSSFWDQKRDTGTRVGIQRGLNMDDFDTIDQRYLKRSIQAVKESSNGSFAHVVQQLFLRSLSQNSFHRICDFRRSQKISDQLKEKLMGEKRRNDEGDRDSVDASIVRTKETSYLTRRPFSSKTRSMSPYSSSSAWLFSVVVRCESTRKTCWAIIRVFSGRGPVPSVLNFPPSSLSQTNWAVSRRIGWRVTTLNRICIVQWD